MNLEFYVSDGDRAASENYNYSSAAIVGDFLILSGVIGRQVDESSFDNSEDEFRDAWSRISKTLGGCGSSLECIVEIQSFHRETDDETVSNFIKVKNEMLGTHKPAWTAVGTDWLAVDGGRAEIRVAATKE